MAQEAVSGRNLESWAQALFRSGALSPQWHIGQTVTYTVLRDGHLLEVPIRLGHYPLGALLQDEGGFLAFTLFFALVGTFVLLRRPNDRAARTLFQSAWCLLITVPWAVGLLAVIYEVSVFTLQSLTAGLTLIRGNQLALIASTLLIGVLFKPLHDRTRAQIDRRFYRRKYDAARTIATFSATIRDEVDLNQLCAKLMAVVEETMQPTQVSLWIRPPKWRKESQLPADWT